MLPTSKVKIRLIAKYYGLPAQRIKAVEELAELQKELIKFKNRENIIDELADASIMINQIITLMDAENEVDERMEFKLSRQLRRIRSEAR